MKFKAHIYYLIDRIGDFLWARMVRIAMKGLKLDVVKGNRFASIHKELVEKRKLVNELEKRVIELEILLIKNGIEVPE